MILISRRAAGGLVAGLILAMATPSLAQSPAHQDGVIRDSQQLIRSLRAGGYNIVVRHGATFTNQADTNPFNLEDIAKQRNLNDKGKNNILITHKPNIIDALGKDWFDVKEGEASIFKPEGGKYRLVARVPMEDWPKLAVTAN